MSAAVQRQGQRVWPFPARSARGRGPDGQRSGSVQRRRLLGGVVRLVRGELGRHVDLGVYLGGGYVDLDVDDHGPGEADAAQGEKGQGGPGEDCDPGGEGAARFESGLLAKRRCSGRALFGHSPTVAAGYDKHPYVSRPDCCGRVAGDHC